MGKCLQKISKLLLRFCATEAHFPIPIMLKFGLRERTYEIVRICQRHKISSELLKGLHGMPVLHNLPFR